MWIVAATFSPDGRFLYLVTRHAGTGLAPGLQVHERDPQTGKLTKVACYNGISSCPTLDGVGALDRVRDGRTELRADASQLIAIPDAAGGNPGGIVTFARAEDGTLSDEPLLRRGRVRTSAVPAARTRAGATTPRWQPAGRRGSCGRTRA